MSNFFILLKCDLLKLFGINKALHTNKKSGSAKIIMLSLVAVLVLLFAIGGSVGYTLIFAQGFPVGSKHKAVAFILFMFNALVLIMTIGSARTLFGFSDYDMLMAMPLRPQTIFLAKVAYIYIVDFLFAVAMVIPSATVYGIVSGSGIVAPLNALLLVVFLPLPPLVIGMGVGTVFAYISARIKHKNILGIIFSVLFLIAYFWFVFGVGDSGATDEEFMLNLPKFIFIFEFVAKGIVGQYIYILLFDLVAAAVTVFAVYLLSVNYKKINTAVMTKSATGKFEMKETKVNSCFKTLLLRELKMFTSTSSLILNSLIGPLLAVAFSVFFMVKGGVSSMVEAQEGEDMQAIIAQTAQLFKSFLPYIPVFFVGISTYASYSISLEGKTFWQIKTLPVSASMILLAKLAFNLLLCFPAASISVIVFGIALGSSVLEILASIIIIGAYTVFGGLLGLSVNMKWNNFTWQSPVEIIKRGTSSTICMLAGMLSIIPLGAIQFVLSAITLPYVGWAVVFVLLVGLAFLFGYLVFSNSDKKLLKIN